MKLKYEYYINNLRDERKKKMATRVERSGIESCVRKVNEPWLTTQSFSFPHSFCQLLIVKFFRLLIARIYLSRPYVPKSSPFASLITVH